MSAYGLALEPRPSAFWSQRFNQLRAFGLGFSAPLGSVVTEVLVCHHDDPAKVGGLGLITVTPWPIFLLAFVLSASFAIQLRSPVPHGPSLIAHVAALAFLIPGLPGLLEQEPRFNTAWLHAGFVQAIIIHKHPLFGLDARFSWPGFFTGMAAIVGMAHLGSALPLIRWTPLVLNLAYALPIFIIARALLASSARAWLVVWLFLLTNWVGQDYFSPQGLAYFILLATIAIVLIGFHRAERPPGDRLFRGLLSRLGDPQRPNTLAPTPVQKVGLLVIAVLAAVAVSMEHQLTPVVLGVDVVALAVARQTSARFYAVAVVVSVMAWISYGAEVFWVGHLSLLFGIGGGAQVVNSTVTSRIAGSTAHRLVDYERVLFAFCVGFAAAVATFFGLLRKSPVPLSAVVLAVFPSLVLVSQSYGGEGTLRIYLYALPFLLIIVVAGLARIVSRTRPLAMVMITIVSTITVPFLLVARFGNEQFEQITRGDVAAAEYVYSVARPGATIASVASNALLRYKDLDAYQYLSPSAPALQVPAQILAYLGTNPRGSYLLVTPAQVEYAVVNSGLPSDWGTNLERALARNSHFKRVFDRFGGVVYKVDTGVSPNGRS